MLFVYTQTLVLVLFYRANDLFGIKNKKSDYD